MSGDRNRKTPAAPSRRRRMSESEIDKSLMESFPATTHRRGLSVPITHRVFRPTDRSPERNKKTVTDFYDLMSINRSRRSNREIPGDLYIQHNPGVGDPRRFMSISKGWRQEYLASAFTSSA